MSRGHGRQRRRSYSSRQRELRQRERLSPPARPEQQRLEPPAQQTPATQDENGLAAA